MKRAVIVTTVDFDSEAGSSVEPRNKFESLISKVAGSIWYNYRSLDGNKGLRELHSVYRPISRSRRLGRITSPDLGDSTSTYDVYNASGERVTERIDEEAFSAELESAIDSLTSRYEESDVTNSDDEIESAVDITQDLTNKGNIHIGHDLGRSKEARASLVPISYETEEGTNHEARNSKKYSVEGNESTIRAPGLKVIDGEVEPVIYDCQVHVDVSKDIMNPQYGAGKTSLQLWRLSQFDALSDEVEDEWNLVDRMLTGDEEFSGKNRKLSRLSKYAGLNINENLGAFDEKKRIFKESFNSSTNMSDLHKGVRASSVYYGVKSANESVIDNVASLRRDAKFSDVFRADQLENTDEFLLDDLRGYSELEQRFSNFDEAELEARIDEARSTWRGSHRPLIPALFASGVYLEPQLASALPSEDAAYEATKMMSDPQIAQHASELAGTAEGASIAFLGYIAVKSAVTNLYQLQD